MPYASNGFSTDPMFAPATRPQPRRTRGCSEARSAFSLTELLVASTIALVVMGAVAQLFSLFSRTLSQSQATVDLSGRMRSTAWQLRQDLAGVTVKLEPWTAPESDAGYFELIEGPRRDLAAADRTADIEADTDDVLLFTTQAATGFFTGKYGTERVEAPCAEVAWFCRESAIQPTPDTTLYNLYRRQLLVVGYAGRAPFSITGSNGIAGSPQTLPDSLYDVSLRFEPSANNAATGTIFPNTLGDLTKRENRFMRNGIFSYQTAAGVSQTVNTAAFPFAFPLDASQRVITNATFDGTDRAFEDVVLTNVVAFDVRVFDPAAKSQTGSAPSLLPGDPAYDPSIAVTGTGARGGYVDLAWSGNAPTAIGGVFPPNGQSAYQSGGLRVANVSRNTILPTSTYDTWSLHYEFNGDDDDGDGRVDEGTNGLDDNGDGLPDNPPEYETSPPYPVPLRGIEVRIRCYEPTSKQVRQITIRHTFTKK